MLNLSRGRPRGRLNNGRGGAAPQIEEAMDIDSTQETTEPPRGPANRFGGQQPPRNPRAAQFEDGKYGFANGPSSQQNSRPYASRRGRGAYGRLASDAIMRDEQQSNRRSNW